MTLAAIAGAHGISGEVRLKLFAEGLESLKRHKRYFAGEHALTLQSIFLCVRFRIAHHLVDLLF